MTSFFDSLKPKQVIRLYWESHLLLQLLDLSCVTPFHKSYDNTQDDWDFLTKCASSIPAPITFGFFYYQLQSNNVLSWGG